MRFILVKKMDNPFKFEHLFDFIIATKPCAIFENENDFQDWIVENKLTFVRDKSLFGGYYRDNSGITFHIDIETVKKEVCYA